MSNKIYRVVLIEPSFIVQQGMRMLLQNNPLFQLVGTMPDLNRCSERLVAFRPDIAIVNPILIDFHRRGSLRTIISNIKLVGLSYTFADTVATSQFATMIGILDSPEKIESKLREVITNIEKDANESDDNGEELSDREKEILISVATGMINKEIAIQHNISIHTVISHRKNISRKTGIKSVSGLTVYALLNSLIEQGDVQ